MTADAAERDSDTIGTLLSVGMTFLESGGKELTGELLGRDSVTTLDQGFDVLGRFDVFETLVQKVSPSEVRPSFFLI